MDLLTQKGASLHLSGSLDSVDPHRSGSGPLTDSKALVAATWLFGTIQHQMATQMQPVLPRSGSRDQRVLDQSLARAKKRAEKNLAEENKRYREEALFIARVTDNLNAETVQAWCSACYGKAQHRRSSMGLVALSTYACASCGTPTTPCAVPRCESMAMRGHQSAPSSHFCAEHRHDIASFAMATQGLRSIDDYRALLRYEKRDATFGVKIALAAAGAGAIIGPAALLAAPAIGGALGASALGGGLSGAAATSHGLAMLGGGAIASGGFGMAGGVAVVTAAGGGLGAATGASVVNAYARQDKSFAIVRLRSGTGPPVLIASGFLTENDGEWGSWRAMIDERFPQAPVYRVLWGAKDLKALGTFIGIGGGKLVVQNAIKSFASRASRQAAGAPLGLATAPLLAAELMNNPWRVARKRAEMTGAVLADILARCPGQYVLVGHSLGAAVMTSAASALGTRGGRPPLLEVHLLAAAVPTSVDWGPAVESVTGNIYNYHSRNDRVLRDLFRAASLGKQATGMSGILLNDANIHNVDVSDRVLGHSDYFGKVELRRPRSEKRETRRSRVARWLRTH